jgi:hypothetical protein
MKNLILGALLLLLSTIFVGCNKENVTPVNINNNNNDSLQNNTNLDTLRHVNIICTGESIFKLSNIYKRLSINGVIVDEGAKNSFNANVNKGDIIRFYFDFSVPLQYDNLEWIRLNLDFHYYTSDFNTIMNFNHEWFYGVTPAGVNVPYYVDRYYYVSW